MSEILDKALEYASWGFHVWPQTKRKTGFPGEHGLNDATNDPAQIRALWDKFPDANVAVHLGRSNLLVVDCDDNDAKAFWDKLVLIHGGHPETMEHATARGRHILFRHDGSSNLHAGKLGPKLEFLCGHHAATLPPSIHITGKKYVAISDCPPAPAPEWLVDLYKEFGAPADAPATATLPKDAPVQRVPEGGRNTHLCKLAGSLRGKGCSPEVIEIALLAENAARLEPPLTENAVLAIARSIGQKPAGVIDYLPLPSEVKAGTAAPVESKSKPALRRISTVELLGRPVPPVPWLVEGLVAPGLTLLTGPDKVGKSFLALQLASAVAKGEPVFGRDTSAYPVLYVDLEMSEELVAQRMKAAELDGHENLSLVKPTSVFVADDAGLKELGGLIETTGAKCVFLDTLFRCAPSKSKFGGNAYEQDMQILGRLHAWIESIPGLCVVAIHHTSKARRPQGGEEHEAASGSRGITASCDILLTLGRSGDRYALHVVSRYAEAFSLAFERHGPRWECLGDAKERSMSDQRREVLSALNGQGMSASQLAEALGKKRTATATLLSKMLVAGVVEKKGLLYYPVSQDDVPLPSAFPEGRNPLPSRPSMAGVSSAPKRED